MVRFSPDPTGRLRQRTYYTEQELDREFETLLEAFFGRLGRAVVYPLDTEDLIRLIEERTSDFDQYGDLDEEGIDVEGVTRFRRREKPDVIISARLSEDGRRSNRFRTTLAHEFGHVHLHDPLVQDTLAHAESDMLRDRTILQKIVCHRDSITDAKAVDWMEWQACYASGAILMPRRAVRSLLEPFHRAIDRLPGPMWQGEPQADAMVATVRDGFRVSQEAASVRLRVLGHLVKDRPAASLFD